MLFQRNRLVKNKSQQQGAVIVVALFIMALAAAMAYAMVSRLSRDIERTHLIIRNVQAELYAQGAVTWAKDILIENWKKQKNPNQATDKMPIHSPKDKVNGYEITSTLTDMQSKFNINNLSLPEMQPDFKRLFTAIVPDLPNDQVSNIIIAIIDWINPQIQDNEFNKYYLSLPLPYQTAHRPMLSISELQSVKGMTPALFAKIEPYLTALPSSVQINIQSASVPVLLTLSPSMTLTTAQALHEWLSNNKEISKDNLMNLEIARNNNINSERFVITSQFFLLETKVMIEDQVLVLYTLLQRITDGNKATVIIFWQSKNLSA
jgi:general secretion pathway protein K